MIHEAPLIMHYMFHISCSGMCSNQTLLIQHLLSRNNKAIRCAYNAFQRRHDGRTDGRTHPRRTLQPLQYHFLLRHKILHPSRDGQGTFWMILRDRNVWRKKRVTPNELRHAVLFSPRRLYIITELLVLSGCHDS